MKCSKHILLSTAVFFLLLPGCKKSYEVSTAAYIVGPTNDIKKMGESERREVPASVYNASVLIATQLADKKIKFCSGTLIASDAGTTPTTSAFRVLTNHHCFAKQDSEGKALNELFTEACQSTRVYFGYFAGLASGSTSTGCEQGSLRTNFNGDIAVFTLSKNPEPPYGPMKLWDGDIVPEGRKAYIVHYPDISDNLEQSTPGSAHLPVASVTIQDCKVSGLFDPAEWELDRTLPYSMRHTCDLIHGSSGSALVDAQTTTMIGVNWGGIKITYSSGTRVDNVATRIDFVKAFLEGRADSFETTPASKRVTNSDNAVAGTLPNTGGEKNETSSTKKRKSICGVITGATTRSPEHNIFIALLFMIVPFIVVQVPRFCRIK